VINNYHALFCSGFYGGYFNETVVFKGFLEYDEPNSKDVL